MKISRYFTAGFAALITLTAMLFAPMAASASDGTFYQNGAWTSHSDDVYDGRTVMSKSSVYVYAIEVLDDAIVTVAIYREPSVKLFDIKQQRELNWLASDAVKRSMKHELAESESVRFGNGFATQA